MQHTQGPWTLAEANSTIPIKGANGLTVASVRYGENDYPNAKLIAAAPRMLEALEGALEALDYALSKLDNPTINGHRVLRERREEIRAAITEATQS